MNEIEAREIGTAFLKEKGLDVNAYGEVDKLGEARDCTIFFLFPIVGEDGDGYLGGRILALDKKTRFSLPIASGSNFFDYHIWLFRTIILNQLYDFKLSLEDYGKKKESIKTDTYIKSILLLLEYYPEEINVFFESLQILIRLDDDQETDVMVNKLEYEALSSNSYTVKRFRKAFEIHKDNPVILPSIQVLEKLLQEKKLHYVG